MEETELKLRGSRDSTKDGMVRSVSRRHSPSPIFSRPSTPKRSLRLLPLPVEMETTQCSSTPPPCRICYSHSIHKVEARRQRSLKTHLGALHSVAQARPWTTLIQNITDTSLTVLTLSGLRKCSSSRKNFCHRPQCPLKALPQSDADNSPERQQLKAIYSLEAKQMSLSIQSPHSACNEKGSWRCLKHKQNHCLSFSSTPAISPPLLGFLS